MYILQTYLNILLVLVNFYCQKSPDFYLDKSQEAYLLAFNKSFVLPKKEKETFMINVLTETKLKHSRIVFQVRKDRYFVCLTF